MGDSSPNAGPVEQQSLIKFCTKWNLFNPTLLASTFTSDVFKVEFQSSTAVLKIFKETSDQSESKASVVLKHFDGQGAVHLLESDSGAHLLEFIEGPTLRTLVEKHDDPGATEIICDVLSKLHRSTTSPDGLITMKRNFKSLFTKVALDKSDPIYTEGARVAEHLLETESDVRVLHGDIHHENILKGSRGWLAIDPKCLMGERTYDTANTFYNPPGFSERIESKETIERRSLAFAKRLNLDRQRILEYAFAYGCLSAAWSLEDGQDAEPTLRIARRIQTLLRSVR